MSAPIETSNGARGRRSKFAGEGLVTPIRPMQITCEGVRETIHPTRHRFAAEHEVVVQRPELFTPCNRRDSRTATELRAMIARSSRQSSRRAPLLEAEHPTWKLGQGRPARPLRLPDRRSWRLP